MTMKSGGNGQVETVDASMRQLPKGTTTGQEATRSETPKLPSVPGPRKA